MLMQTVAQIPHPRSESGEGGLQEKEAACPLSQIQLANQYRKRSRCGSQNLFVQLFRSLTLTSPAEATMGGIATKKNKQLTGGLK